MTLTRYATRPRSHTGGRDHDRPPAHSLAGGHWRLALRPGYGAARQGGSTGGLVAGAITAISGSSKVFERGFVTYSNQAKSELLGVSSETLKEHGAVSSQCAVEMAKGAVKEAGADAGVAITGIAGPDGGSDEKPVGLVFIAVAIKDVDGAYAEEFRFGDIGRNEIRSQTIIQAMEMLLGYAIDDE